MDGNAHKLAFPVQSIRKLVWLHFSRKPTSVSAGCSFCFLLFFFVQIHVCSVTSVKKKKKKRKKASSQLGENKYVQRLLFL